MPRPRLVLVTWNDAQAGGAEDYDKARHHKPSVMQTLGWLMDQDDTGISIACERYHENGKDYFRGSTFVPSGMVISVKRAKR